MNAGVLRQWPPIGRQQMGRKPVDIFTTNKMATGSEVLFELLRGQFKAASDALVCCLHWNMITNGFRCIGKGEEVGLIAFYC